MRHGGPRVFEAGRWVLFNADHWALNPPSYLPTQKEIRDSLCSSWGGAVGFLMRIKALIGENNQIPYRVRINFLQEKVQGHTRACV